MQKPCTGKFFFKKTTFSHKVCKLSADPLCTFAAKFYCLLIMEAKNQNSTNLHATEKVTVENRKSGAKDWWVELRKAHSRHAAPEEILTILRELEKQLEAENKLTYGGTVAGGGTWRGTSDLSASNPDLKK